MYYLYFFQAKFFINVIRFNNKIVTDLTTLKKIFAWFFQMILKLKYKNLENVNFFSFFFLYLVDIYLNKIMYILLIDKVDKRFIFKTKDYMKYSIFVHRVENIKKICWRNLRKKSAESFNLKHMKNCEAKEVLFRK